MKVKTKYARALETLLGLDGNRTYRWIELITLLMEAGLSSSYACRVISELARLHGGLEKVDYGEYRVDKAKLRRLLSRLEKPV